MDMKNLGSEIVLIVKDFVDKRFLDFKAQLSAIEAKFAELPPPVNGKDGAPGEKGETGLSGEPGPQGEKGEPGQSIVGEKGEPGVNGRDGEDGKDALEVDVMRSIDESKRYRRGTWAAHNGGLWVTRKTSEGLDGWECVIDGIADIQIEQKDDRTFSVVVGKSSGELVTKSFSLPVMIYKDLFKEGNIYKTGDVVTWAGHMWVCKKETDAKPQEGDVWRIAVKRGQDGKAVH